MHANELIRRIITRIPHHTEGERDEMLAAVDHAFPVHVPEPDTADDEHGQEHAPDGGNPPAPADEPYGTPPMFQAPTS